MLFGAKWEEAINERVCALDIDGVLNYYPDPWVDFINDWLDTNFRDLTEAKNVVPYQKYRDLKYNYRESGYKATLKVRAGASKLTHRLKREGYTILIITSRPFQEHKGLFKLTTDWLNKNNILYDSIIDSRNKHVEVLLRSPRLDFMIEDHRYYANLVASWGYKVYLMNNQYNQGSILPGVKRIYSLEEVLDSEGIR